MTCLVSIVFAWPDWTLVEVEGTFFRNGLAPSEPFKRSLSLSNGTYEIQSQSNDIFGAIDLRYFMRRNVDGNINQGGWNAQLLQSPNQTFRCFIYPNAPQPEIGGG